MGPFAGPRFSRPGGVSALDNRQRKYHEVAPLFGRAALAYADFAARQKEGSSQPVWTPSNLLY